jgi:drug/metabolite transporter (DMT)-like permease
MMIRSIAGFIGTQGAFSATKYMPISSSTTIRKTIYPTILAIIAHFYLGEKISKFDVIAIFTSIAGVSIINLSN